MVGVFFKTVFGLPKAQGLEITEYGVLRVWLAKFIKVGIICFGVLGFLFLKVYGLAKVFGIQIMEYGVLRVWSAKC